MKTLKNLVGLSFLLIMGVSFGQTQKQIPQVEELLKKMTLEEKIGQLNLLTPGGGILTGSVVSEDVETKIKAGNVGGLFGVSGAEGRGSSPRPRRVGRIIGASSRFQNIGNYCGRRGEREADRLRFITRREMSTQPSLSG